MINELVDKVANKSDDIVYLTDEIVVIIIILLNLIT